MISHLQVMTIYVGDLERACTFYSEKLGFELRADWHSDDRSERMLFLLPDGAKETLIGLYAPPAGDPKIGAAAGIVFTAEDVENTYQQMQNRGVVFSRELTVLPYGNRPGGDLEAEFTDPDGNRFLLHT
jgi:catechol 2,3-dioxygenase-like lactoylglutathione lyase family enzyme